MVPFRFSWARPKDQSPSGNMTRKKLALPSFLTFLFDIFMISNKKVIIMTGTALLGNKQDIGVKI
jgi:hypothetical protein